MNSKVPHSSQFSETTFDKQGHRGCRGLMPENTIAAMYKAIDLGVTTLEMDASISKDNQVFLSHEPFFNHEISLQPNGNPIEEAQEKSFNMYQMDYAQIIKYDVGLKPHPRFPQQVKLAAVKPLLSQVFDSVLAYCKQTGKPIPQFNIETKTTSKTDDLYHPKPEKFVDLLMQVIASKNMGTKVIIQSFDIRTLQYLHQKDATIKTALLIEDFDKKPFALQLKDLGFIPSIYSPAHELVTPLLVKQCRDAGIQIIPWTVNDLATIRSLKKMGVHGVISDYPNLFAQL
jgi:glycerophosphoryl diester phosphodiesterase